MMIPAQLEDIGVQVSFSKEGEWHFLLKYKEY